jgi:hypothetical protein
VAYDQRIALNMSLNYFSGNLIISAESVASKVAILLPCARALLRDFSLFACEHRPRHWMFGIASGPVRPGDVMRLENKSIWERDTHSKFEFVIRCAPSTADPERVDARMIGVCIHPGRYRPNYGAEAEYVLT